MNEAAAFLFPTSEEELSEVYTIDRSQVGVALSTVDNQLKKLRLGNLNNTSDGRRLRYLVVLYASVEEPILDGDLERWLCDNKRLVGREGERARVAVRVRFRVRAKFQNAGLATHLCRKEESYFRRWGAKEIHVWAMEMGRWVWTRPRFGYQISDFEFESTQQKYIEWQRAQGRFPIVKAPRVSDFPRDFLLGDQVSLLTLYKVL
jgi:GNAT superfamily N-acetyltransferase